MEFVLQGGRTIFRCEGLDCKDMCRFRGEQREVVRTNDKGDLPANDIVGNSNMGGEFAFQKYSVVNMCVSERIYPIHEDCGISWFAVVLRARFVQNC